MKLTHIASATTLIEHNGVKILTDPWLIGDEFYGSWTHYPPMDVDFSTFDDVDFIYISHIHPDHMSKETLDKINKEIPVLIHNYDAKFVKTNLERWGRRVIELNHGEKFHCGGGLNIHIYAADNCNPQLCFKFFGCGKMEPKMGSTGIDTLSVIENGTHSILNVNDCPYDLTSNVLDLILENHGNFDLLLTGYAGAGSYPQCWECYSDDEKLNVYGEKKKKHFLLQGLKFIEKVQPKFYMPFAGTYTLRGKLAHLEKFRVVPELQDALEFYRNLRAKEKGILLNRFEWFDLESETVSKEYEPIDYKEKIRYVEEVLSNYKFDYESDKEPSFSDFEELLGPAFSRYESKRKELNFSTDTTVYVYLPESKMVKISCSGDGFEIINNIDFSDDKFVTYRVDPKLLLRILKGPRFAHWNNAEIGSHIQFSRKPEIYERALYFCMNYFHC